MPASVWKGFISFGLVSFPVQLFSAARAETVRFHMLHRRDLSRVRQVLYCAEEDSPIERSDTVKGYETGKDEYVAIEAAELKKIAPPTASSMNILQFVGSSEVDPIYFERSYYLAPDLKAAKPYSLFLAALTDTALHAIAKIAMHNREHVVLIRPFGSGLVLHTLYYQDELNENNKSNAPGLKHSAKELELARSLVKQLSSPFDPGEFHDTYGANIKKLIEQKQSGKKITLVKSPRKAPVIDLMDALKRSLKAGKAPRKPAASGGRKAGSSRKSSHGSHAA